MNVNNKYMYIVYIMVVCVIIIKGETMTAVITGIGITSSCGNSDDEINHHIGLGSSGISDITYFDTNDFIGKKAGSIDNQIWDHVKSISRNRNVDISSALSIYTIGKLLSNHHIKDHSRVAISLGSCNGGLDSFTKYIEDGRLSDLKNYPVYKQASDIADYFGFVGPKYTFNSACAASGNAITFASDLIESDDIDYVIAGGCDPMSKWVLAGFNSLRALNSENCIPYGKDYGLNLGEAATFFIIESKNQAIRENKKIYGEIVGYGLSNDAYHPTAPDKDGKGIATAISMALENSSLEPNDIFYINSHGTGTRANDLAEYNGFKRVFKDKLPFISSMKGYAGHNLGAAASTELAFSLIGINNKVIYPNYGLKEYREGCEDEQILKHPVFLNDQKDIYILNNNAAFGGQNVAIVLHINLENNYSLDIEDVVEDKKVYIDGWSQAINDCYSSSENRVGNIDDKKPLKSIYSSLYKRRMNALTQYSIIAAKLALNEEQSDDFGLIYGTPFGSLNSTEKYVNSIQDHGFSNASGAHFPDLVLNSTAGRICQSLGLKGFSSSCSSGPNEGGETLSLAFEALKQDRTKKLLVGIGQEKSKFASKLIQKEVCNYASFFNLKNYRTEKTIAELVSVKIKGFMDGEDLLKKLKLSLVEIGDFHDYSKVIVLNNTNHDIYHVLKETGFGNIDYINENDNLIDESFNRLMSNLILNKVLLISITDNHELALVSTKNMEE